MSVFVDSATDLSDAAAQIAVDLAGDVASDLKTLGDFVIAHKARSQNVSVKVPLPLTEDPAETLEAIQIRLRRAEANLAKAADLIVERRKEIADLLATIA
jgi:hypothetical protein